MSKIFLQTFLGKFKGGVPYFWREGHGNKAHSVCKDYRRNSKIRGRILQFFVRQKILKFGMIQQLNRKDHYDGNEPWLLVQVDP